MNPYAEFIDFLVENVNPETLIAFKASEENHTYFYELLDKEKAGFATIEERKKIDQFMELEHILRKAKVKARQYVKK